VRENVFPGKQPFVNLHRESTLEQNRLPRFGGRYQKLKVLRIPRANLDNVSVFGDHLRMIFREQLSDHREASSSAGFSQQL